MKPLWLWLMIVGLLVFGAFFATFGNVFAATLEWDRNAEPDMKQYHVYVCPIKGCTATATGSLWKATIPQPAAGVKPSYKLPDNMEGAVAVTAEDTSNNTSGVSVSLPFSSILVDLLAPAVPKGLLLKP